MKEVQLWQVSAKGSCRTLCWSFSLSVFRHSLHDHRGCLLVSSVFSRTVIIRAWLSEGILVMHCFYRDQCCSRISKPLPHLSIIQSSASPRQMLPDPHDLLFSILQISLFSSILIITPLWRVKCNWTHLTREKMKHRDTRDTLVFRIAELHVWLLFYNSVMWERGDQGLRPHPHQAYSSLWLLPADFIIFEQKGSSCEIQTHLFPNFCGIPVDYDVSNEGDRELLLWAHGKRGCLGWECSGLVKQRGQEGMRLG